MSFTDWDINVAGQPGQLYFGATMPDAPSDGTLYGRVNATWVRGVKLGGDTMTGLLTINAGAVDSPLHLISTTYARVQTTVGANNWYFGTVSNGSFDISSQSADCINIAPGGAISLYQPVTCTSINTQNNNINAGSGTISCSTVNASNALNASGSIWCNGQGQFNGLLTMTNAQMTNSASIAYPWTGYSDNFSFAWSNTISGLISGIVDAGGAQYALANASDERLKQDIVPSTQDWLEQILAIPLFQYRWKDHAIAGEPVYNHDAPTMPTGLVAQRLYEVAPHLVQKGDNYPQLRNKEERERHLASARERDTNVRQIDVAANSMWGIDTNNMLATLCGAVQQLAKRVEELEAALQRG